MRWNLVGFSFYVRTILDFCLHIVMWYIYKSLFEPWKDNIIEYFYHAPSHPCLVQTQIFRVRGIVDSSSDSLQQINLFYPGIIRFHNSTPIFRDFSQINRNLHVRALPQRSHVCLLLVNYTFSFIVQNKIRRLHDFNLLFLHVCT